MEKKAKFIIFKNKLLHYFYEDDPLFDLFAGWLDGLRRKVWVFLNDMTSASFYFYFYFLIFIIFSAWWIVVRYVVMSKTR